MWTVVLGRCHQTIPGIRQRPSARARTPPGRRSTSGNRCRGRRSDMAMLSEMDGHLMLGREAMLRQPGERQAGPSL